MTSFDANWLGQTAPLNIVIVGGLILLLFEAFITTSATTEKSVQTGLPIRPRTSLAWVALVVLGLAAATTLNLWTTAATPQLAYTDVKGQAGMIVVDRWALFLDLVFFVGAALSVILGGAFMREHRFEFGEYYALVLFATTGMVIIAHAADLVVLFIGIETMSLAVYVLVGCWRRAPKSSEGAMKYFLVGAFASAVMLYGIALLYGASGTSNMLELAAIGRQGGRISPTVLQDPVFLIGGVFLLAGLAFKIAAVPFHMWAPDTYEGAPTPVTAFMAAAVKAAAFGALVRVLATALGAGTEWVTIAAVLATLTMSIGNLGALRQENVKRMLAYSSVAHAGYLLVGVTAMSGVGAEARGPILYYLLGYTFTTIGSFAVVAWIGARGDERQHLDDWAGLAAKHPAAALFMTVFLLSLGGIPPTAGFFGKFYIFRAALGRPGMGWLVLVAVANSLVSVFYYLRVVSTMYFREPARVPTPLRSTGTWATLILCVIGTLGLGLMPGWLVDLATQATLYLAH